MIARLAPGLALAIALMAAPLGAQDLVRPSHVLTRRTPPALSFVAVLGVAGPARLHAGHVARTAGDVARATPAARDLLTQVLRSANAVRLDASAATIPWTEQEPIFVEPSGELAPPSANRLLAPFGPRQRTTSDTTERHTGLTFAPSPALEARAIAGGVVVFCDTIDGLGLVVVVDHGRGWMSVYANLARSDATPMMPVAAGEAIGAVGAGSAMGADGLYLELRHQGIPVDPEPWLEL